LLKLILLENKPLLACFGFVTSQKWLVSIKMNLRKRLNLIDVGAESGALSGVHWSPLPLTPNPVELIPTLGSLILRGGPVQDPVLTRTLDPEPEALHPKPETPHPNPTPHAPLPTPKPWVVGCGIDHFLVRWCHGGIVSIQSGRG